MTRVLAIVLVTTAVLLVRRHGSATNVSADIDLAVGFTLAAALVAGDLLRNFRFPRLTGYLLFGLIIGPYLGNVINEGVAAQLQTLTGLATTLIAFIAGLSLNFDRLQRRTPHSVRLALVVLSVAAFSLGVLAWFGWRWLPIAPRAHGTEKVAMVALLVVTMISFSPTMTAAVIAETGARGRFSQLVLAVVVLGDLVVLLLFSFLMQGARVAFGDGSVTDPRFMIDLLWEIGGALGFGTLIGALFALYLRYVGREMSLALLAVCALLSQIGVGQGFQPLLAALAAGLVIENVAVAQGDTLKGAIQASALPVLILFFVAVGASLRLDMLLAAGQLALVFGITRVFVIRLGTAAALRSSSIDVNIGRHLWTGLVSQAGITLGLAAAIAAEFPGWGSQLQALVIAVLVFDELTGPFLFRLGLVRSGEIETTRSRPLLVVSNREPYLHNFADDGSVAVVPATGGVAVALDALMRERRGIWIAHGAGTADRDVVNARDKIAVPPDRPSYQLRRLWFEPEQFAAYYRGFANEGLWPLCHLVDVRPKFRVEDWEAYQAINAQFAMAIADELPSADTPVFIQDYHLALVAPKLRALTRSARTALFWHIPWPYPDRLRICPWRRELLTGLLANDLLAFQVDHDRDNFLLAVDELGGDIEEDGASVRFNGGTTAIISVPIGVDYDRIQGVVADAGLNREQQRLVRELSLTAPIIGLGVDRLDYTKGIPERLEALDRLFTRRPTLRGRLTFVQIGVPSRSELQSYSDIEKEIDRRVTALNAAHGVPGLPPPVRYYKGALHLHSLVALYRLAHFCIVSSLADGMNLVAKEFVAARDDEDGVLILSTLAGAAQELGDALLFNPYDVEGFADALERALDMSRGERLTRMRAMRRVVAGRDVFGWASDILEELESLWTKPLHYASGVAQNVPV